LLNFEVCDRRFKKGSGIFYIALEHLNKLWDFFELLLGLLNVAPDFLKSKI